MAIADLDRLIEAPEHTGYENRLMQLAGSLTRRFLSPEHVAIGRFSQILERIVQKEQLLAEGRVEEAAKIRIIVYFQGGGQAVAEEIGFVQFMQEQGWFVNGVIDTVIAGSGGSLVAAFGVTGNTDGINVLKKNCEKKFAGMGNMMHGHRLVCFSGFGETLEEIQPDEEALKKVKSKVLVTMFNTRTRQREAVDIRFLSDEERLAVLRASCLIPKVGDEASVVIGGTAYNDGDMGGIPHALIDAEKPTDVLVVGSGPLASAGVVSRLLLQLAQTPFVRKDPALAMLLSSAAKSEDALQEMWKRHWYEDPQHPVNYAYIGPHWRALSMFTQNWRLLERRIAYSRESAARRFDRSTLESPSQRRISA